MGLGGWVRTLKRKFHFFFWNHPLAIFSIFKSIFQIILFKWSTRIVKTNLMINTKFLVSFIKDKQLVCLHSSVPVLISRKQDVQQLFSSFQVYLNIFGKAGFCQFESSSWCLMAEGLVPARNAQSNSPWFPKYCITIPPYLMFFLSRLIHIVNNLFRFPL